MSNYLNKLNSFLYWFIKIIYLIGVCWLIALGIDLPNFYKHIFHAYDANVIGTIFIIFIISFALMRCYKNDSFDVNSIIFVNLVLPVLNNSYSFSQLIRKTLVLFLIDISFFLIIKLLSLVPKNFQISPLLNHEFPET